MQNVSPHNIAIDTDHIVKKMPLLKSWTRGTDEYTSKFHPLKTLVSTYKRGILSTINFVRVQLVTRTY